jgi:hypothetical protein
MRDRRLRILLAKVSAPPAVAGFYERALRREHDVLTCGPKIELNTLQDWKTWVEAHTPVPPGATRWLPEDVHRALPECDIPVSPGQPSIQGILSRLPPGWRPDLFVWIDGGPFFRPADLGSLACPTVGLIGGTHNQLEWRREYARPFAHVFLMYNRQHLPLLSTERPAHWLPPACEPSVHCPSSAEKVHDLVFVGQPCQPWTGEMAALLRRIRLGGFRPHAASCLSEEAVQHYRRSRIVLYRSQAGELSSRVFEALAAGSLLFADHLDVESGLQYLFQDRVHLVLYEDGKVDSLLRYYLARPTERLAIERAGRREVLAFHTYTHRCHQLLAAVFGEEVEAASAARVETRPLRPASDVASRISA